jgi:hypothetical protein
MIEKTLKTTKGKLKIKVPTDLAEITLGQMIGLQENPLLNDIGAISILSGIGLDELQNVSNIADLQIFAGPVLSLSNQIKELYNSDAIPKKITFKLPGSKDREVKVMSNLSVEPAGAFMAARDIIAEEINEHVKQYGEDDWKEHFNPSLKACCQVLAHYFFCRATGKKYNEYKADEFGNEIKKLRVTEALPIAKHFFTCYPSLLKPKTGYWHRLLQRLKKGLAYKPSKSLNISTP